ncbi:MAG: acyltransferase [Pseudomonadota bacterium]|nr:acyltransferase [Pseudomonadota bacterium]
MRRDNRPLWWFQLHQWLVKLRVRHFIRPQLDGCGKDLQVMYPGFLQLSGPAIAFGNHVHIMALPDSPVRLSVFERLGSITVGDYCIINPGVRITSASQIIMGHSCLLAMNCYITDADWHDVQHRIYAPGETRPVRLGDNVWIGDSAIVTKGVTIGSNSIIGAGSVVTKDIPENVIAAGNPARVVRQLDGDDLTDRAALFNMAEPYSQFEARHYQQLLTGNTLSGWLKSLLFPGRQD